ncbi:hypothetical protein ACGFIR_27610 [Micromonospora sp. NPDC049051]|uniref:hypothetical protein n=1 Tax=Micromonospora sp. NPDC049051 TaxID=3364264 RepID=UPI003710368D
MRVLLGPGRAAATQLEPLLRQDGEPAAEPTHLLLAARPVDSAGTTQLHEDPEQVMRVLAEVVGFVKEALASRSGTLDTITILVGEPETLGMEGRHLDSAVAGALLSMGRTWAIEFARDGIRVNTLVHGDLDDPGILAAVVGQLGLLGSPQGRAITGQEIYLCAGADLGRLHA